MTGTGTGTGTGSLAPAVSERRRNPHRLASNRASATAISLARLARPTVESSPEQAAFPHDGPAPANLRRRTLLLPPRP